MSTWHDEARRLHAQGLSAKEIALKTSRPLSSVYRAIRVPLPEPEQDPGIPGLLPIRNRQRQIVDFARVHIEDWHRLRGTRLHFQAKGYVALGDHTYLHHAVVGRHLRKTEGLECDHINRDKTDNRRSNLRIVTSKENAANRGGKFERAA